MEMKVCVMGAAGRMGKEIIKAINNFNNIKLSAAVEVPNSPVINSDSGEIAGIGKNNILISDSPEKVISKVDVVIDFTSPESTLNNLDICEKNNKGIVIGTTGLDDAGKSIIKDKSKKIPIVFSPNMSVGVNLLFKLVEITSKILNSGYDVEIIEAHHRFKKDAPSGTAKKLEEIAAKELNIDDIKYGREGFVGERKEKEIGVFSIRAGDIVGDHTVMFSNIGERIELTHKAHSRATFANGAVKAALFLQNKTSGLYSMFDVLGIK